MPKVSELFRMQDEFQEPRKLNEHNNPRTAFNRMMDEVEELYWEIAGDNPNGALEELVDVFILGAAVGLALTKETGKTPEDFDDMIMKKFLRNQEKYDPDFFNSYDVVTALRVARHWWALGLHEDNPHQGEDF